MLSFSEILLFVESAIFRSFLTIIRPRNRLHKLHENKLHSLTFRNLYSKTVKRTTKTINQVLEKVYELETSKESFKQEMNHLMEQMS